MAACSPWRHGYLRDHPIERVLRDVRVHQILEGTNEVIAADREPGLARELSGRPPFARMTCESRS